MNFLCDSIGVDRSILDVLDKSLDENRSGEKFVLENSTFEQEKENDQIISRQKVKLQTCDLEYVFVDGYLLQSVCVEKNGNVEKKNIIQIKH